MAYEFIRIYEIKGNNFSAKMARPRQIRSEIPSPPCAPLETQLPAFFHCNMIGQTSEYDVSTVNLCDGFP